MSNNYETTFFPLSEMLFSSLYPEMMWYLGLDPDTEPDTVNFQTFIQDSFSFFILYSYLIPISLYVSLGKLYVSLSTILRYKVPF